MDPITMSPTSETTDNAPATPKAKRKPREPGTRAPKPTVAPSPKPAPAARNAPNKAPKAMNDVERGKAIRSLLADLSAKPPTNVQKGIRRNLRALGHRGGLRATATPTAA